MLFIPRYVNESIKIGNDIEVKISRVEGNCVCLGIQAPRELAVNKKETFDKFGEIMKRSKPVDEKE